ncbi:hypothetical protein BIFADO_02232 [Bifidobacterium adolescentis L2-32]|uniref:Uncharacterized protein n=1 Tax=Bifidobacterium adolescentis L2-32 TaxID=411481 RepID=A7A8P0_BIFAD|nr:hypothetical protein BIFADO_02232 [Bifidobacterium adolescentis L2-32]
MAPKHIPTAAIDAAIVFANLLCFIQDIIVHLSSSYRTALAR